MDKLSNSRLIIGLATAFVAVVALLSVLSGGSTPGEATPLGQIPFTQEDGTTGSLDDHLGQPLVINYFASWCAPCRAELPDLQAVSEQLGEEVTFLGVNTDINESTWRSFVGETGITYETVFDPGRELFLAMEAKGMPTTVFLSAEGEILNAHTGILNQTQLIELIDTHLR
jgi:cytochrome c biogenesis protein CcmG/thiol:disulfide interchange protein DsbE